MELLIEADGSLVVTGTQGEKISFFVSLEAGGVAQSMLLRTSRMQIRDSNEEVLVNLTEVEGPDGWLEHSDTGIMVTVNSEASARVSKDRFDLFIDPDELPLVWGKFHLRKAVTHA